MVYEQGTQATSHIIREQKMEEGAPGIVWAMDKTKQKIKKQV